MPTESADAREREECMQSDIAAALRALGMPDHARDASPHEVMVQEVIPGIESLQRLHVEACERSMRHVAVMQEAIKTMQADIGAPLFVEAAALERIEALEAALRKAEQFIANGVEFGYIRMPDADTPDPAHETLPAIRAALPAAPAPAGAEGGDR